MTIRTHGIAALAASLFVTSAFAQDIEPNQTKAEATAAGVINISAGGTITGTTTGTVVTLASTLVTTVDTYRVRTGALPLGVYEHRLTITSPTVGHTGTLRGTTQTGTVGVGGTATTVDTGIQTSLTTSSPPRFNQWYGFGKQEEMYYRIAGTTATTAAYTATLTTNTIVPGVIAQSFESANPITITTIGQTAVDTELMLYDSAFNPVPNGHNDDEFAGPTLQSKLVLTLAPGTYYLAVSTIELCSNQGATAQDDFVSGWMTDFPDCVAVSTTVLTNDYDFQVQASNGIWNQPNQLLAGDPFRVTWWQFTTAAGAPPIVNPAPANDNCASAAVVPVAGGTATASMLGATNDGAASCDPGGAASKDVWFSYTNTNATPRVLALSTCGTTGLTDTVLSVYNSCGGAEVACNDDNAGCAAQPLTSSLSGVNVNASQTVLIRLSDKGLGGPNGNYTLAITVTTPPPPNDLCTGAVPLSGLGTFAVSNVGATTGPQGQTEAICNFFGGTAVRQDIWFTWVATNSGSITLTTCPLFSSGSSDTKIAVYDGAGCPTAAAIACNDDGVPACPGFGLATTLSFNAVCGNTYTFQFGMYQGSASNYTGGLGVSAAGPACSTPSTPECIGDTAAACPCSGSGGSLIPNPGVAGNGCANNSFPNGANLSSSGIAQDNAGDTLVLTCSGMPGPGLFIQSNALAGPFVNFNDGILCAAVGIIRMGVVFPDANGNASYPGGLTPAPIHVAGAPVLAPSPTKHYQCWYRDITPGFCNSQGHNMSNGLAITWTP